MRSEDSVFLPSAMTTRISMSSPGASVEFIRRFEADYTARPAFLTENYRSTAHIIAAANRVIEVCTQSNESWTSNQD